MRWSRNSARPDEADDVLHDVYERALVGASRSLPDHTRSYVFTVARNLLITRARRAKIISFDLFAEMDQLAQSQWELADRLTPERHATGRQELQRAIEGMDNLPPRCREVLRLRKIEGLSTREVADRLGVSISAVEQQLTLGMRALANFMLGGSGQIERHARTPASRERSNG